VTVSKRPAPQDDVRKAAAGRSATVISALVALVSGVVASLFALVPSLTPDSASGSEVGSIPTWVYVLLAASAMIGVGATAYRWRIVRRRRQRKERYGETIAQTVSAGASHAEVRAKVEATAEPGEVELALMEVEKYFVDASPELRIVEAIILDHPPLLPRAAKRMMNHARLLTGIANARGLFNEGSELTAAHLAKWIVLSERWPSLAHQISRDPGIMTELEDANSHGTLQSVLARCGTTIQPIDDIGAVLSEGPQLGPNVKQLIHFDRPTRS
jgi:hypothetical protein